MKLHRIRQRATRTIGNIDMLKGPWAISGRIFISIFTALSIGALAAQGQTAQPKSAPRPEFDIASIKGDRRDSGEPAVRITPGRLTVENMTLRRLIFVAYRVRDFQIVNAPSWTNSERYDIDAKTDGHNGVDTMLLMLGALLEDRFRLRYHHETKEGPVYVLTVAKSGNKMQEATCTPFDPNNLPKQSALSDQDRAIQCSGINRTIGTLDGNGMLMEDGTGPPFQSLAGQISLILDRPVINRTRLTGRFDVHLHWAPDPTADAADLAAGHPAGAAASSDTTGPSIFTALEEQLGLKLESAKGSVDSLVIDHVARPTEN